MPSQPDLPQSSRTQMLVVEECWPVFLRRRGGWSQVLAVDAACHSDRKRRDFQVSNGPSRQTGPHPVVFVVEDILSVKRSAGASIIASESSRSLNFHIMGHKADRQSCGPLLGKCYKRHIFLALHVVA